ncbi:tripartite motif-containing protein 3-like [Mya arenaria]|uniref:tripartite motif-containing protein 3-like n=1 Tax=Mya arenaria TaxID=6604 RepID=UPI0022E356BC|nr:tripartite motif-containing protein 3-like [Mya arenaria]
MDTVLRKCRSMVFKSDDTRATSEDGLTELNTSTGRQRRTSLSGETTSEVNNVTRIPITSLLRTRRRTRSEKNVEEEGQCYSRQRRVTFADIDELHSKFGSPLTSVENGGKPDSGIKRNCAEIIPTNIRGQNVDENQNETSQEDSFLCHVNIVHKQDCATKPSVITTCETVGMTFGRKGKGVGEFQDATGLTFVSDGCVLVTDMVNGRIQRCMRDGKTAVIYGGLEIREPWSTCITRDGDIALTCRRRRIVLVISQDGEIKWSFGAGLFQAPSGICSDDEGNFIVTDAFSNRVSLHTKEGQFVKYIGNHSIKEQQFASPRYVCISRKGEILVSDSGHHCVKIFDKQGHYIRSIGKFGKRDGELKTPYGVCTDDFGHVIVADHYNNRVSMFTHEGVFVCHVADEGHGVLHPKGLDLSPDLTLFVSSGHLKACEVKVFKLKPHRISIVAHV